MEKTVLFNAANEDQNTALHEKAALYHSAFAKSVSHRVDQLEEMVAHVQNIVEEDQSSNHVKLDQLARKQSRQVVWILACILNFLTSPWVRSAKGSTNRCVLIAP